MDGVVIWCATQGTWCFLGEHVGKSSESTTEEQEVHIFYLQVFRMNGSERKRKKKERRKERKSRRGEEEGKKACVITIINMMAFLLVHKLLLQVGLILQSNKVLPVRVTFTHIADEENSV